MFILFYRNVIEYRYKLICMDLYEKFEKFSERIVFLLCFRIRMYLEFFGYKKKFYYEFLNI